MNTLTKSFALAAVMMASAGLMPQFTRAQSAVQVADCNDPNRSIPDCGPFSNTTPNFPSRPAGAGNPAWQTPTNQNNSAFGGQNPQFQHRTGGWQYDPRRNHRQVQRNNIFQYPFGGFFYDQPYWQLPQQPIYLSRISCAQGRSIVAARGYNSVRTISCNGSTYTYQARRLRNNYEVSVNARRGTISGTTLD